eukprot:271202-Hanusia_phi.AAC.5
MEEPSISCPRCSSLDHPDVWHPDGTEKDEERAFAENQASMPFFGGNSAEWNPFGSQASRESGGAPANDSWNPLQSLWSQFGGNWSNLNAGVTGLRDSGVVKGRKDNNN